LKRFSKSEKFALFLPGHSGKFAGVDCNKQTKRFNQRVIAFLNNFSQHITKLGFEPKQFIFSFVDEAGNAQLKKLLQRWMIAADGVKAKGPNNRILRFGNPRLPIGENNAYKNVDILFPHFTFDSEEMRYFTELDKMRDKKHSFGFYLCSENTRQYDPYTYYSLPFRAGCLMQNFHGVHFWDMVTAPQNFDEYTFSGNIFSPLYYNDNKIYASKQIAAVFAGREDYEYFKILCENAEKIKESSPALYTECQNLIKQIKKQTFSEINGITMQYWQTPKKRDTADTQQLLIWHMLNKINKKF
jgi:hypothetical protein